MCGLFSIFPKEGADALSLRVLALFLGVGNVPRGRHSFGMWGKGIPPFRSLGAITDDDNIANFRSFIFNTWQPEAGAWMAGHTRQATHGARTIENTHPFELGTLTLAHNGVVKVDGLTEKDHPVDSGQIAISVVTHGWAGGLAKVSGSCGLVASVGDKLYLYRHSQVLHVAEGPWGWAVSSEKSTLKEALVLAGLEVTSLEPVVEEYVTAPWDGTHENCPAAVYKAPATEAKYGGYVWDSDRYGYEGGYEGGYDYSQQRRGKVIPFSQPPLTNVTKSEASRVSDEEAKKKFLTRSESVLMDKDRAHEKAATMLLALRGKNTKGAIVLSAQSATRAALIKRAVLVERFEREIIHVYDPNTKQTTQCLSCLNVPLTQYEKMTDEEREVLWVKAYAETLNNIGVTTEEFMAAQEEYAEDESCIILNESGVCDWCGTVRDVDDLTDRIFGSETVKVCKYCDSEFKAARRGMDYRSVKGGRRDQRRVRGNA
jgi:hypothetical protein